MNNINIPPSVEEFVKDRLGKPENFVWDSEVRNVVWLSYGKDSMAQLLFLIYLGVRIDEVCFVDIRFSKDRSGEHPKMEAWIPTAHKILKDMAYDLGLENISCHSLRKTFGFHAYYEGGKDIALVMSILGHKDSASAIHYIGVADADIKQVVTNLSYY